MRKRSKVRITTNEREFLKYASRLTYIGHKNFGKNLVVIHEKKELLTLNKPICVGCTILELSKLAMYEFYYSFVKKKCENPTLLSTDTDGFIFETKGNFYEIIYQNKDLFDLSNFTKDSKYYCADNKKVLGKMKDKYGGTAIYEFVGPKPKMYSILDVNNCEKVCIKGIILILGMMNFKMLILIKKLLGIL